MKIVVGSTNRTKIEAVKDIFPEAEIDAISVASGVSSQPMSDLETKRGAMNRAKNAQKVIEASVGIGLEGGVMFLQEELFLCNWGALITPTGKLFTASGARIKLPNEFIPLLQSGNELSDVMESYTKKENIRVQEGAIGIFTNNLLMRKEMFAQVVQLLRGQMEYWDEK